MRTVPLTVVKGGINRLRIKGGAKAETLYDLVNGYRTADGSVRNRPGTFSEASLAEGLFGLAAHQGKLHLFAATAIAPPNANFVVHVLTHPDGAGVGLKKIHFAAPYSGFLYVVAEWLDEKIFHYWLQSRDAWEASTVYKRNQIVTPSVANGYLYRASRLEQPYPAWTKNTPREVGDRIEPTQYNNFFYECVAVEGANPKSGSFEPIWPTSAGEQVVEDTTREEAPAPATPTDFDPTPLPWYKYEPFGTVPLPGNEPFDPNP